jgi:DNA-directed RNA polymerase specialized sigma24 family protein
MSVPAVALDHSSEREQLAAREQAINLCVARAMLSQWGRCCRASSGGYPTMAATEKARIGRGGIPGTQELPERVRAIDVIVARSPRAHRVMLVESYTKGGTTRQHAARLGLSSGDYWRRRTRAEEHVRDRLQLVEQ